MKRFVGLLALALSLCTSPASARGSLRGYQRSNVSAGFGSGGGWQGFSPTWIPGLALWLRADRGVTAVIGPVTAAGTTPPTVTLSGTPSASQTASATPYVELDCTLGGALGVAQFTAKVNGAATMTGVATSASVAITGSGVTASWAAGVSTNNDVYTSNVVASALADQSGLANNAAQATAASQPIYVASDSHGNGRASLTFAAGQKMTVTSAASLQLTGGMTIAAVIRSTNISGFNTLISKGVSACEWDSFTGGNVTRLVRTSTAQVQTSSQPTVNVTTSVIVTTDQASHNAIYLGGVATTLSTTLFGAGASTSNAVFIGERSDGSTQLVGQAFEYVLVNRYLDAGEVARLHSYQVALFAVP